MNLWLVSLLISGILLTGFLFIGAVLLVVLNGFKGIQAAPVIAGYGLLALGLQLGLTSWLTGWIAEHWLGSSPMNGWTLLGLSLGSLVIELVIGVTVRATRMKLQRPPETK